MAIDSGEPLRRARFRTTIRPRLEGPNNGFLVFGEESEEPTLVKCGLFVGGNYAAIYEGTYPSADTAKLSMPLEPGKTYDVEVCVDLDRRVVEMVIDGKRLEKKLTTDMEAIRYYGYSVVWTRTEFGPVEITR